MTFIEFKNEYSNLNNENEQNNFIRARIEFLLKDTYPDKIGINLIGSYSKFISPEVSVKSNSTEFFSDLKMDDLDIYKEFMTFIKNDVNKYLYGEPTTIIIIQQFIWNYFGYNSDNLGRMNAYSDNLEENLSIKELKNKNIAACSERSVLAHNLLMFLGIKSEIIFGKLNQNASHAYIIFQPESKNFKILYDPMNPVPYTCDEIRNYGIGVSKMDEDEYNSLKNGGSFDFKYDLVKKIFSNDNIYEDIERQYTSDDFKYINLNKEEISPKSF